MGLGFALKFEDVLLDIQDDTNLTVEWYSTLFNENELFRGSYSYAIKLPLTEKNKSVLKLPHLLENRLSRRKIEVSVILLGQTWKNAILSFDVQGNSLSANLLIDSAIIADVLRDTTLPDLFSSNNGSQKVYDRIDIGADTAARLNYMYDSAAASPGVYPMVFPVHTNYGYLGDGTGTVINEFSPSNQYLIYDSLHVFSPTFYLTWIIERVCAKMGFKVSGSFFENSEIRQWVIFNTGYYTGKEMVSADFQIIPSRHLPNIAVGNLFKILRNDLKLGIHFDSLTKIAAFELPNNILAQNKYIDFGSLITKNSLKIKNSEIKKFVIKASIDDADAVISNFDQIESLSIGQNDAPTKIELSISAPRMSNPGYLNYLSPSNRLPFVDMVGNVYDSNLAEFEAFNQDGEISKNTFSFRLMSYKGLKSYLVAKPENLMPYATTDNRDIYSNVDPNYLATDPFNEGGWLRALCEPFYQMLNLSEQVEFDAYTSIDKFMAIQPLAKSQIVSKNGARTSILFDRITFEPGARNASIFARVKAYTMNNSFSLIKQDLRFKIEVQRLIPDIIYVSATFDDKRIEPDWEYITEYARVLLEFWGDKYKQNRRSVINLEVNFQVNRYITTSQSTGNLVFDRTIVTGVSESYYVTHDEFTITSTRPGGEFYSEVIVTDSNDNKYIVI